MVFYFYILIQVAIALFHYFSFFGLSSSVFILCISPCSSYYTKTCSNIKATWLKNNLKDLKTINKVSYYSEILVIIENNTHWVSTNFQIKKTILFKIQMNLRSTVIRKKQVGFSFYFFTVGYSQKYIYFELPK